MSTEGSANFESLDSESPQEEDYQNKPDTNIAHTTDKQAAQLVEALTFRPQNLVDVNVYVDFDNMIDKTHLSPRGKGRGRGRNNTRGRHNTRGRGGRTTNQLAMGQPQDQINSD